MVDCITVGYNNLHMSFSSIIYGNYLNANNNLESHCTNKSNPHNVTAAQIGLGNVNNTADSAKSVSYATNAGSAANAQNAVQANKSYTADLATAASGIKDSAGNSIQFAWDGTTSKIVIAVNGIVVRNI